MDDKTKQLLALGREHYEKREFERAEQYLRQIVGRGGTVFADVSNMLGVIYHDRGAFEDAQASFEEALAVNPNYTEAALNLAVTYNDLGRYEDAKRIYQATLEKGELGSGGLDPFVKGKIANLHGQIAQAYADAGLCSEAMHELRKAVLLCPEFADLRLKLANLYRQTGDPQAALYELQEAAKMKPEYVPVRVTLGIVKLTLGDVRGAVAEWQHALRLDPEDKTAQMYLRMAQTDLGPAGSG